MLTHELQRPSHMEATAAIKQEIKIVPRRPKRLFSGAVSQHPNTAQAEALDEQVQSFHQPDTICLAYLNMERRL